MGQIRCTACHSKNILKGRETFYTRRQGITKFWCAPILRCYSCGEFLEPAYARGIRECLEKVHYEEITYPAYLVGHYRGKKIDGNDLRPVEGGKDEWY